MAKYNMTVEVWFEVEAETRQDAWGMADTLIDDLGIASKMAEFGYDVEFFIGEPEEKEID
jgi:hypothetical protein